MQHKLGIIGGTRMYHLVVKSDPLEMKDELLLNKYLFQVSGGFVK